MLKNRIQEFKINLEFEMKCCKQHLQTENL